MQGGGPGHLCCIRLKTFRKTDFSFAQTTPQSSSYIFLFVHNSIVCFAFVNPSKLGITQNLIWVAFLNPNSFKLGVEKRTEGISGTKRSTASLAIPGRLDGLVIVSSVPTADSGDVHLVERRWLEPGGTYQTQVRSGCRERAPAISVHARCWLSVTILLSRADSLLFSVVLLIFLFFEGLNNKQYVPGTSMRLSPKNAGTIYLVAQ